MSLPILTSRLRVAPAALVFLGAALLLAPAAPAVAQSVDSLTITTVEDKAAHLPPLAIAEKAGVLPLATLGEIQDGAGDQLAALEAWNTSGRTPFKNGIVRPLPVEKTVAFDGSLISQAAGELAGGVFARASTDALVWGAEVRVDGSYRLRLHLSDVSVPAGTRFWIYGEGGESRGFGTELVGPDGGLWTPSVTGPVARLEVELPDAVLELADAVRAADGELGFTIDQISETVRLDSRGAPLVGAFAEIQQKADVSCLVGSPCVSSQTFPAVRDAERAIAQLSFMDDGAQWVCTGSLLNDLDDTTTVPYLLTANHCFDNQAAAATMEATFDYKTDTCTDEPLTLDEFAQLPKTVGSTLMATGQESDFTLVRLTQRPPGQRTYLGWNAERRQPAGTVFHRISHPVANTRLWSQVYTRYQVMATQPCETNPNNFYNLQFLEGGTFGGSSGAPNMLGNGQVVGTLTGACGPIVPEGCDYRNTEVDGTFWRTFDSIEDIIAAEPVEPGPDNCPARPAGNYLTTPEIPGFRFKVRISAAGNAPILGTPVADCIGETLCVAGALPDRVESFVRIVGPRPNGFLWPIMIKFTSSQVEVWIEKTSNGACEYYVLDEAAPGEDVLEGLFDRTGFQP